MPFSDTAALRRDIERVAPSRPFRVELWDGTALPVTEGNGDAPTFRFRSPHAIAHSLRAPGQLGLGRAYVSGDLEVDDLDAVMRLLDTWQPPPIERRERLKLLGAAIRACGLTRPPPPPEAELRPRGTRHSKERDRRSVRHHYDVSNEFFELFLGESMAYSCAVFSRGAATLEEAQDDKHELVCSKLALKEGDHVLDVGSGWGSFAIHAAQRHGARVTGITLSEPQAELADTTRPGRRSGRAGGHSGWSTTASWPASASTPSPASAWSSTWVKSRSTSTRGPLAGLLEPGRQAAQPRHRPAAPLRRRGGAVLRALRVPRRASRSTSPGCCWPSSAPGFETHHVEGFRDDYAETLRHWAGAWTSISTRRSGWPGPSGSASGGCTSAPRATASRPASRRSTRYARAVASARGHKYGPDRTSDWAWLAVDAG